jgi:hypothetical protein
MDKLLGRMMNDEKYTDLELYLLTFGISSDPLTQFAMVLASLVHDGTGMGKESGWRFILRTPRSLCMSSICFPIL